jgi:diguanylate cyclase (GGDEF)-like protein
MTFVRLILAVLIAFVAVAAADARTLRIGAPLCHAVTPDATPDAALDRLAFTCTGLPSGYQGGSLWLRDGVTRLPDDQSGLVVLVHQTRFDRLTAFFTYADGAVVRQSVRRGDFGDHWRVGAQIAFDAPVEDAALTGIVLRFDHLASHEALRLRTMPVGSAAQDVSIASALVGASLVLLLLGTLYNLCLAIAIRRQYLAWHALWACCTMVWGAVWSQSVLLVLPGIAGTISSQLGNFLSSASVAAASMSAATAFGAGYLPRALRLLIAAFAAAMIPLGLQESLALDASMYAHDGLHTFLIIADLATITFSIAWAWRAGSAEARDLAGAWSVPMATLAVVTLVDIDNNLFGGGPQIAVLFASAFQTIWLSIATTRRLAHLRVERDAARAAQTELGELASRDPLTGLLNRRGFVGRARTLLAENSRGGSGLLLIDVDHFKAVNDLFGHETGDEVLVRLARRLQRWEGPRRLAGRLGGEEFLLGTTGLSLVELGELAERVRKDLSNCDHGAVSVQRRVTVSIGVAEGGPDASFEELYGRADAALYEAKRGGRDQVAFPAALAG